MPIIETLPLICITLAIDFINWPEKTAFNKIIKILKTKDLEHLYLGSKSDAYLKNFSE